MNIEVAFNYEDISPELREIPVVSQKLWLLYKNTGRLTSQHFVSILSAISHIESVRELSYVLANIETDTFEIDQRALAMSFWDYLNPVIQRKITVIFPKGSSISRLRL